MKQILPTYCDQCYNGPDLLNAVVEDGIVHSLEPNANCASISPGKGKICVKAYGLIQKLYNPDRIQTPLIRTNPRKGRDEDPGWKAISWDEAMELLAGKMQGIRDRGVVNEEGHPRLAVIMGQAASPAAYSGTMPAFFSAWGPVDFTLGAGEGIKCYHSEHLYGEYWHRCFIGACDTPRTKLVISFGHNTNASGGVAGVQRHADSRAAGNRRIQIEPHLSASATTSDEWVPIKVKTDAAFMYALIYVLIREMDCNSSCDLPFLKKRTSSPYLVGPGGWFMRDRKTGVPLVWDTVSNSCKQFNALDVGDYALEGEHEITGFEQGPDGQEWQHESVACKPSFQLMRDFITPCTPEWAAAICDVPVETIRRIAGEIVEHAHIGETIEVCGEELPYRPVAIILGKTVNNGPGGYQVCWARTVLAMLIGALEVPGGTIGASQRMNRPHHDRWSSVWPGNDGFMKNMLNPTDRKSWPSSPRTRSRFQQLLPFVLNTGWSPFLGPTTLGWLTLEGSWEDVPRTSMPDLVLLYRANPAMSMYFSDFMENALGRLPFFACIGYTHDESNHFADLILPDHTDLEGLQLFRIGPSVHSESFWSSYGFALRQAAVEPVVDSIDLTDFSTRLAHAVGIHKRYYEAINAGLVAGVRLKSKHANLELNPDEEHGKEEIWDRLCRSATLALSDGRDDFGLEWFGENGFYAAEYPEIRRFLHPVMVRWGLRYELPYQENVRRIGMELAARLHENGFQWWDTQLDEYAAFPECIDFSTVWDEDCRASGCDPDEYRFWLVNTRSMQYAWGSNASIPLMAEAAKHVPGFKGMLINTRVAEGLGISEGDIVRITSPASQIKARAVLREGVRPDTVVFTGQFGHWKTPFAKDLGIPNFNALTKPSRTLLDSGGSLADVIKVKIEKD